MAIQDLTSAEIEALVGTRHATAGFEYAPSGMQPYYQWLIRTLHLLGESSIGSLRVVRDDVGPAVVRVLPGRATLDGAAVAYNGGTLDLAAHNNDVAYIWLEENAGVAALGSGSDAAGWPTATHLKLAEVTLAAGQITAILDRRGESLLAVGLGTALAQALPRYSLSIGVQGSSSTPSTVRIQLQDGRGQNLTMAHHLRVRICDGGGYAVAASATIAAAPGGNTTLVETMTAGKDLVFRSHTDGVLQVQVTSAVAQSMTLRIGAAPLSGLRADCAATLDLTHA